MRRVASRAAIIGNYYSDSQNVYGARASVSLGLGPPDYSRNGGCCLLEEALQRKLHRGLNPRPWTNHCPRSLAICPLRHAATAGRIIDPGEASRPRLTEPHRLSSRVSSSIPPPSFNPRPFRPALLPISQVLLFNPIPGSRIYNSLFSSEILTFFVRQ